MRLSLRIFSAVFVAFSLASSIGVWTRTQHLSIQVMAWEMLGTAAFLLAGAYLATSTFRSGITLSHDSIELQTPFKRRCLALASIRGRREYEREDAEGGKTKYLKIIPRDDSLPTLAFPDHFDFDTKFYIWYDSLPDLDALERMSPDP